jgi:hypothetical protein
MYPAAERAKAEIRNINQETLIEHPLPGDSPVAGWLEQGQPVRITNREGET